MSDQVSQSADDALAQQIANQANPATPPPAAASLKRMRWKWWVPLWVQKAATREVRGRYYDPDDLSAGETPPPQLEQSVDILLAESKSRRRHRMFSAMLVFGVVACLVAGVRKLLSGLSKNLQHIDPAAVGLVASLVIAISVLTLTLVKYAFSVEPKAEEKGKEKAEPVGPPVLEAVKVAGELVSKAGEMLAKVAKP